jgi:hypothetical protein
MRVRAAVAALVALALLAGARQVTAAPACEVTWVGPATGNWTASAANWSTGVLPAAGDDVCVPEGAEVTHSTGTTTIDTLQAAGAVKLTGGTLTLAGTSDDSTAARFDQSGGTLAGAGRLVVGGTMAWSGGRMSGPGTTAIAAAATLTVSGNGELNAGRVLENAGAIDFVTDDRFVNATGVPAPLVRNLASGVIRRTVAGAGTIAVYAPLDNDGAVRAQSGLLDLRGGGSGPAGGDFGAAGAAGTVRFSLGTFELGDGAGLLGGVRIAGGVVNIAAGATATATGSNSMTAGDLAGAGTLGIAGPFAWSGGRMSGAGTTAIAAGTTLTISGNTELNAGRVLENAGTIDFTTDDRLLNSTGVPAPLVRNLASGLIQRTVVGPGTIAVYAPVDNEGAVRAQSGLLDLRGGGSGPAAGEFGAAGSPATVRLSLGTFELGDGARLLGGVRIAGGFVNVAAGATAVASGSNSMTGGTVGGTGTLSLAGAFGWSGGTMSGTGITRVLAGTTLTQTGMVTLAAGRTLDNAGEWDMQGDRSVVLSGLGAPPEARFLNSGTLRKSSGTGTGVIDPHLRNDGTVAVEQGKLELWRGDSQPHTGTFIGASDAALPVFTGDTHVLAGTVGLPGVAEIRGGTVKVADGEELTIAGTLVQTNGTLTGDVRVAGTFRWTGGRHDGPGTTTVAPEGALVVDAPCLGASMNAGRRIVNLGTIRMLRKASLSTSGVAPPAIENAGRLEIDDTDGTPCAAGAGIVGNARVVNASAGVIEKQGGSGMAVVEGALDNDGAVRVSAGTLKLRGNAAATHTGSFEATAPGSELVLADGPFALAPGAALAGHFAVEDGELEIPRAMTVTVDSMRLNRGTLSGAGTLRVLAALDWRSGTQRGPGVTLVEPAATVQTGGVPLASLRLQDDRVLVNRGALALADVPLTIESGSSLLNAGTLELAGAAGVSGAGSLLHNTGLLRKSGGAAVAADVTIDNEGTIEVTGGTLVAERLLNHPSRAFGDQPSPLTGGDYVLRGGRLRLLGAVDALAARVVLDGAGAALTNRKLGGAETDALGALQLVAGAGALELAGGRSLTVPAGFANRGVLDLGAGSALNAQGAFSQAPGAVLRTAVSAGGFGRVAAAGAATLAGRLDVRSAPGYQPAHGTAFEVLTASARDGEFETVTGTEIGGGTRLDVEYTPTGATLRSAPAGAGLTAAPPAADGATTLTAAPALSCRPRWGPSWGSDPFSRLHSKGLTPSRRLPACGSRRGLPLGAGGRPSAAAPRR